MNPGPSLAVFGAAPRFREPIEVGQFYWPPWDRYEEAARGIFARRYYTAQRFAGPLVVEFQQRLEKFLGVKHAVVVRNATNGLMIVTHVLGVRGRVIVPSWTSIATVQALHWASCQPAFCDIDPSSQQISLASVRHLLNKGGIKAILGVHPWGGGLQVHELEALAAKHNVPLYFDAAHAFGCLISNTPIGTFGRASVFSLHASNIVSTAEGGCIVTNDDDLARQFKAMRGDHTARAEVSVQSATARMSEMQAAVGMALLDEFERNRDKNAEQHKLYQNRLSSIPGITVLKPKGVSTSNFQHLVGLVDETELGLTRDELLIVLRAENVEATREFDPPCHSVPPFRDAVRDQLAATEAAAQKTFQLPLGARVTAACIDEICDIMATTHRHADAIRSILITNDRTTKTKRS